MNSPSTLTFSFDTFPKEAAGCAACLGRVQERLQTVRGVDKVEIEEERRRLRVAIGESSEKDRVQAAAEKIIREVATGYGHEAFRVGGMDCPSCAKEIEVALRKMPGVLACSVDFPSSRMRVEVIKDQIQSEQLGRAVRQLGFSARPLFSTEEVFPVLEAVSLAIGAVLWGVAAFVPGEISKAVLYGLATLISAHKMLLAGVIGLFKLNFGMNVLMTIAVLGALAIKEWPEAALAAWLFAFGNLVQTQTSKRTRSSVKSLLDSAPRSARKLSDGKLTEVDVTDVLPGDILEVLPHSQVPLDGTIESGSGFVNNSILTGESEPVPFSPGAKVLAGGINDDALFTMRVESRFAETTYARTLDLIEEGQSAKAPQQEMIDRFAAWYTPVVILLAIICAVAQPLLGIKPWHEALHQAFWLMMVACPCALILSAPVASIAAVGSAGKIGALIKGAAHLDALSHAKRWVFDKTGTLTHARLELSSVELLGPISETEATRIAASLASKSGHPVSQAILRATDSILEPSEIRVFPGEGVTGVLEGKKYKLGNAKFVGGMQGEGTEALLEQDGTLIARFRFIDKAKSEASASIRELQSFGLKTSLLSGDDHRAVQPLASSLNLEDYKGGLSPAEKAEHVAAWAKNEGVVMVGDGINDVAALQRATVSVAMGAAGSESAIESADIVLLNDRIENLPKLRKLGLLYRQVMSQNIGFSLLTKAGLLVFGVVSVALPFWLAVAGDMGVALLVTANALRIRV